MAKIKPFKGLIYNTEIVENISNVISPPWDIIDDEEEKRLYSSSKWNVINLISKKNAPSDVNKFFTDFIKEKVLTQDNVESFYCLRHTFSYLGKSYERSGIFALIKIEDFKKGNIIPHEHVFEKHYTNRYRLIDECRANFSPVFMLYRDKENRVEDVIEETPVLFEGSIGDDSLKFGRIDNQKNIQLIVDTITPEKLFIADGHHRYQAAFKFFQDNPDEKNGYVLVFLANLDSSGLVILPTHRYLPYNISFLENMPSFEDKFDVVKTENWDKTYEKMSKDVDKHIFGVYEKGSFYTITLKNEDTILELSASQEHSKEWLSLDNVILKNIIFDGILNLKDREVFYSASSEYILNEYTKNQEGIIFFVNPVSKKSFLNISLNNEKMPQKSTYFYPKVPTGLVIHKF
jgi:uncharacterized protein (DUF1015 family)